MKHFKKAVLSLAAGSASLALISCGGDDDNSAKVNLRLMETTDIHANVMDHNYYSGSQSEKIGLVRTATLINEARAELSEADNHVLVDNGDLIQGSPMGDWRAAEGIEAGEVHPVYKVMNELDYTVANYGNHEFNYGLAFLAESVNDANFPYISANIFKHDSDSDDSNDELYFKPYHLENKLLLDENGREREITIGFIGFVPPQIMQWDKAKLEGQLKTKDIKQMAERFVPQMRAEGADIVVAIPHSGISTEAYSADALPEHSAWYLADVDGIDAIMFGHSHLTFPSAAFADTAGVDLEAGTIKGVPAVMPGYWGSHLGIIDLELEYNIDKDRWRVSASKVEARAIYDNENKMALVDADHSLVAAVADDHDKTQAYMGTPIGEVSDNIFSFLALVKDDPSIQIVSDAQKAYVEDLIVGDVNLQELPVLSAAAPFKACDREGICADETSFTTVPKGQLTLSDAADLYLYPNTLVAVKVTGAELKGWLECSASQFFQIDTNTSARQELINYAGFPTYNFDVIDGVTYEIDVSQPARNDGKCQELNADAERIVNLKYMGSKVSDEQEFIVASNNYRANGGQFPGTGADHVVINSPDANRTVLANYIRDNSPVTPTADGNWSFKKLDTDTDLEIVFRVPDSERARSFVAEQLPSAVELEINDKKEVIYELNMQ
ncbi:bifunctional 2',3'-cyclic-nucleotide 2'-phosphodiesterase/3'-nucleotidase [Agaribacterium haliotis]|uniref:bifunctional 2',3'-cyclic-nucleotide 2'-phosphodiesterase/3'-nucleotidase n=1 Tax=Agaribacterium haliotis TaxID=2013869 RepID=UPI000BB596DF|nr:bifunctional 2',3'-cyclic-nucleotide 2'-phosphodiesterase/3'-nucleotidase [Agaribacterium haliotis]